MQNATENSKHMPKGVSAHKRGGTINYILRSRPQGRHSARFVYRPPATAAASLLLFVMLQPGAVCGELYVDRQAGETGGLGLSWQYAMQSIGSALALAVPGGTVHVAQGVYEEPLVARAGVTLLGGYPTQVTLAGESMPVLDALAAAHVAAGLSFIRPGSARFDACNVAGARAPHSGAAISVLDALAISQSLLGIGDLHCR